MSISGRYYRTAPSFSLFILCALITALPVLAKTNLITKTWTVENGLPQNSVNAIAQTPDGYIWIATNDGLARFDGVRFKVFKKSNTPELPMNRIKNISVDSAGRLWIWTEDPKTLVVLFDGRFSSYLKGVDFETDDIFRPLGMPQELRFTAGQMDWVLTGAEFELQPHRAIGPADYFYDESDRPWLKTDDGYVTFDSSGVTRYPKNAEPPFAGSYLRGWQYERIGDDYWFFLSPDKNEQRLYRLRNGMLDPTSYFGHNISFIRQDHSGNLWVENPYIGVDKISAASIQRGDLMHLEYERFDAKAASFLPEMTRVLIDHDGNFWGGSNKGLHLLIDEPHVTVYSNASGTPEENIYAVTEDAKGTIWFGAWSSGHLIGYTGEKFITENVGNVYALLADRIGRFWVGSGVTAHFRNSISEPWQDVSKVFPGTDPGAVAVISEDRSGSIWIGGSNGLFRIRNGETHKFTTADGLPGNDVTSFLEVSSGRYLVGTVTGLGVVDGEDATAVTTADGLSGNFIRSLYEDSDGTVWIGTYDSGLTRLKDGHYSAIASGNGLFSDGVFCILEDDDGWFWMSSNQGIYRVRKDELNAVADGRSTSVTSISYGPEDGLRNVEANGGRQPAGYRSRDGRLWFATAGGLAMIDPRKIRQSSTEPPVLIEEISIDQKPVKPENDSIRIEPGQSSLDVAYTALKFRGAERIRFHYRLEGLDDNWTEAGTRRTANFTSLPYGDYTLRVAALSPDGTWSKEGATLRITVVAPFYKTRWFMALAVTVAILLVGGIFLFRMRQLEAINAAQSEFAQRLIDSQEQERSRIALELHDSLGQSLAVIRNRALMGLSTPENNRQLIEQMAEISEASASALEDTRHIAHNLHPYQLEHLGLTLAVRSLVHSVATTSDLVITSDIQEFDADLPPEAAINIYRIAQESLSNIIKHSHADRAEFSLFEVAGKLVLTISDNGRGFDPSSRSRGLGLNGINERAKILKADLKVHSEPGKGTTIVLSYGIPINGNGKADPRLDRG